MIVRLERRSGLSVSLVVVNPGQTLTPPVETEMLRIMQESLNNVEKHAKASTVSITWNVTQGVGALTIADNGRGFERCQSARGNSYGLMGMRERADAIGARINISSDLGVGTTVTVSTADLHSKGPHT